MAQELPGGDGDVCHICLEASPPPMQSGCACRGAAGLAHVRCRAQAARVLQENKGWQMWWECQTCLQRFTGGMSAGLANAWWSEVGDRAEEDAERLAAASNLADSLSNVHRCQSGLGHINKHNSESSTLRTTSRVLIRKLVLHSLVHHPFSP